MNTNKKKSSSSSDGNRPTDRGPKEPHTGQSRDDGRLPITLTVVKKDNSNKDNCYGLSK